MSPAPPRGPFLSSVVDCFTESLLLADNREMLERVMWHLLSGRACPASSACWLLLPQSPLPPSLTHRTSGHRDLPLLAFHLQPSHPIGFLTFNQDLVLTSAFSHTPEEHTSLGELLTSDFADQRPQADRGACLGISAHCLLPPASCPFSHSAIVPNYLSFLFLQ